MKEVKIKRTVEGKEVEITLTPDEVFDAHKLFVVSWMADTVRENLSDCSDDVAEELAERAYDIYCQGDGLTEHESVEKAIEKYQRAQE